MYAYELRLHITSFHTALFVEVAAAVAADDDDDDIELGERAICALALTVCSVPCTLHNNH